MHPPPNFTPNIILSHLISKLKISASLKKGENYCAPILTLFTNTKFMPKACNFMFWCHLRWYHCLGVRIYRANTQNLEYLSLSFSHFYAAVRKSQFDTLPSIQRKNMNESFHSISYSVCSLSCNWLKLQRIEATHCWFHNKKDISNPPEQHSSTDDPYARL